MDVIFLKSLRPLYCDYISRILCVRRAQQGRPPRPPFMYFYSRPCARGDRSFIPVPTFWLHFYSRPYTRGDAYSRYSGKYLIISTRAPTRGATRDNEILRRSAQYFYSRPYTRGDLFTFAVCLSMAAISTRAPTRGATWKFRSTPRKHQFLLAPLHEGRQQFFTKP